MDNISGVTMQDYVGFYPEELSGLASQGDLLKALDTGGYTTSSSGGPLIGQSLEQTVHIVTFDIQKHVPLFKKIVKQPAFATIEEYNRLITYGEGGAFFQDGGVPRSDDAQYERVAEKVKFMGAMGEVTGPMIIAGRAKFGDIVAQQVYNRMAFLLRQVETALFFANSNNDVLSFRGIKQMIEEDAGTQNIIDKRGQPLELSDLEDGAQIIADNYGFPTDMYMSVREKSAISKLIYPVTRFASPGQAAAAGIPINSYASAHGEFSLTADVWLRPGSVPKGTADSGAPAGPGTPTATTQAVTSQLAIGVYYYKVSSVNSAGESLAVAANAAVTISAGTQVGQLVITPTPSGAKSYRIYRGTSATNMTFLEEVPVTTGGTTTYQDDGSEMPGTSKAFLEDSSQHALKQLLPFRKVDLARVSDSTRWMQIGYLTPVLYAPKKAVMYKNIGAAI